MMIKIVICSTGSLDSHTSGVGANLLILNGINDGEYNHNYDGVAIPLKPHASVSKPPFYDRVWIKLSGDNGEYTDGQIYRLENIILDLKKVYNTISLHRAEDFFDTVEHSISLDYLRELKNKFE